MRVKLLKPLSPDDLADLSPDRFHVGGIYELNTLIASVFLAEGWAEVVSEHESPPVHAPAPELLPFGGLVLVVDDEAGVRHVSRILLSHSGYDVVVARHGKEALARLIDKSPDLVVLDLHMPVMNGWQFRAEQRRLAPALASVPVLLMTGEADADACAAALDAVGVVRKPFAASALLDAVGTAMRTRGTRDPGPIGALTRAS
jgi:CheY-like chemotaxis protein